MWPKVHVPWVSQAQHSDRHSDSHTSFLCLFGKATTMLWLCRVTQQHFQKWIHFTSTSVLNLWTCFFSFWKNSFSKNISVKLLNNCGKYEFTYFTYANYTNLILSEQNLEPPTPTDAAPVMTFICNKALPLVSVCPSLNIYGSIKSWQRTSLTVSISFDSGLCLPHTGALESMCLTREAHSPLGKMSKMSGSTCLSAGWNDKNCFSCAKIMSSFDRWPSSSNCQLSQTAITTLNNRADRQQENPNIIRNNTF